ncbi:uncharacterized protein LOC123678704 [Harmonia axyridis]|uniref:uncharacterized protein LOC123678704 n=1 Tax=Harmonia axyridis TaxID=115357 RepID=UPI001E276D4B|nr:uncharacterized protein LOC123678704 [Harmonia axyridis]
MSEEKSFVGHLREFDVKINDWSIFKPRLLNYFTANNIDDPVRKRAILLNLLSEDSYRSIFNLCLPTAPERKTFEELITLFSDHFGTQTSVFAEREKIYSAKKLSSETANDWAARLRNLAAYCEFDEELNIALRDRFIVGYNKGPVMDRLFEERKQISLAEAIRIASSKEAARGKEATPFSLKGEPLFHFRKGSKCAASAKTSPSTSQEISANKMSSLWQKQSSVIKLSIPARPLPFAMKSKVEDELNRLLEMGVISPVEYSEWGIPEVPVLKPDGSIRICGDFEVTVNPHLEVDKYPLPRTDDLFASLAGGEEYTKLDLSNAFNQVL